MREEIIKIAGQAVLDILLEVSKKSKTNKKHTGKHYENRKGGKKHD